MNHLETLKLLVEVMVQPAIPELQWAAEYRSKKDSEYKELTHTSYQTIRNTLIRWAEKKEINLHRSGSGYRRRYSTREPGFALQSGTHLLPALQPRLSGSNLYLSADGFEVSISLTEGPVWTCRLESFDTEILRDTEYGRLYVIFDTKLLGVVRLESGEPVVSLPGFVYGGESEYARATRLFLRNHPESTLLAVEGHGRMTRVGSVN